MGRLMQVLAVTALVLAHVTGVAATENSDIIGIVVATVVGFVCLTIIIGIAIAYCNWKKLFNNWMRPKHKVRMPKAYFKKKKEAKRKLVASSPSSVTAVAPIANGTTLLPPQSVDTATLVQGWHQRHTGFTNRIYEEKDAVVELDEEGDDEFKIETEVVDDEILDVGPYKDDHSKEVPIKGNVYPVPYLFSTADISKRSNKQAANGSAKPVGATASSGAKAKSSSSPDPEYSTPGEVRARNLDDSL